MEDELVFVDSWVQRGLEILRGNDELGNDIAWLSRAYEIVVKGDA